MKRLAGVDLSAGMLSKAGSRNVYDELVKSELTAYLRSQYQTFDLILSADTLVYFGALEEVFEAAYKALRDDGLIIFTVEAINEQSDDPRSQNDSEATMPSYRINPHGRYSHSDNYLREALSGTGFDILAIEPAVLRMEGGNPVAGRVVTGRKQINHHT